MYWLRNPSLLVAAGIALQTTSAFATFKPISQCGTKITESGHYELTTTLLCANDATKPAIIVENTKNVTIHMNKKAVAFYLKKIFFPYPHFEQPKAIGILVRNSKDVEIKGDGGLSSVERAAVGIMARNAEDVKVERLTLKGSKVGVSFQGSESKDGKVEDTSFQTNTCDIQTKLGAETPDVDDSNAQTFCN